MLEEVVHNFGKGPFLYYVRVFRGFLEPPTPYVRTFSLHEVRENCHFLDHPPTPMSLRDIKEAPKVIIQVQKGNGSTG